MFYYILNFALIITNFSKNEFKIVLEYFIAAVFSTVFYVVLGIHRGVSVATTGLGEAGIGREALESIGI